MINNEKNKNVQKAHLPQSGGALPVSSQKQRVALAYFGLKRRQRTAIIKTPWV
jgi:hypothetical protein